MVKYRIRPNMDYGFKKYIIEERKRFLKWYWWKPIRETVLGKPIIYFYTIEEAKHFVKQLIETDI